MEAALKDKERVVKALSTGFSGNLAIVPIMDVLEKVRNQGETGILAVWTPMAKGTVWMRRGDALDAELGVRRGIHALDLMAILAEGSFSFEVRDVDGWKPTIELPSSELIQRWKGIEAQYKAQLSLLPPLLDQVYWDTSADPSSAARNDHEREILGQLRQGCTLLEVMVEVNHDLELVLSALAAAGELFKKPHQGEHESSSPRGDRESPKPIWTAPPPGPSKQQKPIATKVGGSSVGVLGSHHTSTNPKRRFLVSSGSAPASPTAEESPSNAPEPKNVAAKIGARTLLGVPASSVLEANVRNTQSDPLDGIVGEMVEAPPETIRTSSPAHAEPGKPTAAPAVEPERVIPRAQWDGRRNVGGVLELAGRKFSKVMTLGSGSQYSCELVDELHGVESTRWVLKMPSRPSRDAFEGLESEAKHLSHMKHHAIVEFGFAGRDVETPYLFTRYHSGLSLATLRDRAGKLPFQVIGAISKQVLQALVYMHDSARPHGAVVHGNLCPDNVLVGWDGVVKVTGLSSARRIRDGRIEGDVRVQARYSSPELLRGEEFDGRTDVFSVGAMLRFLGEFPSDLDARGPEHVVRRAVESDVEVRYPSAAQMLVELSESSDVYSVAELAAWLERQGVKEAASPAPVGDQLGGGRRAAPVQKAGGSPRRPFIMAGAVLLLGVVALLVFWLKG